MHDTTFRCTGLLLAGLVTAATAATVFAEEIKPVKALYVTGGGWHDYKGQVEIVTEGLKEQIPGLEITVSMVDGVKERHPLFEDENWAKGYDLVIYNKCNAPQYADAEWIERIVKPHREGLPAVVIHGTMHNYWPDIEKTGTWVAFLGVTSRNHERGAPVTVKFKEREHPVLAGLPEQWAYQRGELYRIHGMADGVQSLAVGVSGDGVEHSVAWTHQYGRGRVFGTTIGHANETMKADEFKTLLRQGVLWAMGRL